LEKLQHRLSFIKRDLSESFECQLRVLFLNLHLAKQDGTIEEITIAESDAS
jgi:hypothetical protein